jgi:hypothetical protein
MFGSRGIRHRIDMRDGEIVDDADDFILNKRKPLSAERAEPIGQEQCLYPRAGLLADLFQDREYILPN